MEEGYNGAGKEVVSLFTLTWKIGSTLCIRITLYSYILIVKWRFDHTVFRVLIFAGHEQGARDGITRPEFWNPASSCP